MSRVAGRGNVQMTQAPTGPRYDYALKANNRTAMLQEYSRLGMAPNADGVMEAQGVTKDGTQFGLLDIGQITVAHWTAPGEPITYQTLDGYYCFLAMIGPSAANVKAIVSGQMQVVWDSQSGAPVPSWWPNVIF